MKALKFTLSGKNAFFKKPDVNTYYYFTYGQIHKVALLGMFGAILGYGGYSQKKCTLKGKKVDIDPYPEFYEKLKDLKVSIAPKNERGYIPKKVQVFNNSVGYASREQGGNLIIKEQWLENPVWDIFLMLDCKQAEELADMIVNRKCVFVPYLGKNDHLANITNVEVLDLKEFTAEETEISSLFPKKIGEICLPDDEDEIEEFKYEERLPIRLDSCTNLYEFETFCYTNMRVRVKEGELYKWEDKGVLVFY